MHLHFADDGLEPIATNAHDASSSRQPLLLLAAAGIVSNDSSVAWDDKQQDSVEHFSFAAEHLRHDGLPPCGTRCPCCTVGRLRVAYARAASLPVLLAQDRRYGRRRVHEAHDEGKQGPLDATGDHKAHCGW